MLIELEPFREQLRDDAAVLVRKAGLPAVVEVSVEEVPGAPNIRVSAGRGVTTVRFRPDFRYAFSDLREAALARAVAAAGMDAGTLPSPRHRWVNLLSRISVLPSSVGGIAIALTARAVSLAGGSLATALVATVPVGLVTMAAVSRMQEKQRQRRALHVDLTAAALLEDAQLVLAALKQEERYARESLPHRWWQKPGNGRRAGDLEARHAAVEAEWPVSTASADATDHTVSNAPAQESTSEATPAHSARRITTPSRLQGAATAAEPTRRPRFAAMDHLLHRRGR